MKRVRRSGGVGRLAQQASRQADTLRGICRVAIVAARSHRQQDTHGFAGATVKLQRQAKECLHHVGFLARGGPGVGQPRRSIAGTARVQKSRGHT